MRLALVVLLAGGLLAACSRGDDAALSPAVATTGTRPAPTSTTTTEAATTSVALADPCTSAGLAIEQGEGKSALGHGLYVFEVRNRGAKACRIVGYPKVVLVDGQGRVLTEAQTGAGRLLPARAPSAVTIRPGDAGFFGIESTNVCNDGARPTGASAVRVTPPGQTGGELTVEALIVVCPSQAVLVSPVRATEADLTRA